jgi:hypothetical protein
MSKYSNFCYYYEFIDHYMGSKHVKVRIPISKLDEMSEKYTSKDDDEVDECYDWLDEIGVYAMNEVLLFWDDVRKDLETKGIWGANWEEGSHAISMDSAADARAKVGDLELDVFKSTGGW